MLKVEVDVKAGSRPLKSLEVDVNDVPVFGSKGLAIEVPAGEGKCLHVDIPLTAGSKQGAIGSTRYGLARLQIVNCFSSTEARIAVSHKD